MKRLPYILLLSILMVVLTTCTKRPELKIYNLELSEESVAVTPYTATITANYTYPGSIPQIKVCTSTSSSMADASETDAVLDNSTMTATIGNLSSDTKYYYRFRYSNGINLIYTDIKDFTTEHAVIAPTVITVPITSISANSAISGGAISDNGGADIIEKGVCWSTSENPTIDDPHTSDGTGNNAFVSNITELRPNTLYYVRAYATNSDGIGYGNELSFTTTASLASITTKTVTNITPTSASCGGNITNDGGMEITARGVCWSTEHNPSIDDQHTNDGTGIGDFNSEIAGLTANVKYYVRSYATNSYGTSYGNEVEFTTQMGMPTVTTKSVTGITATSATSGGDVTNIGGGTVSARGVCWSTSENPTITDNHTTDGTGVGEFTSSITGLTNNVTYYVRAYATNSNGTSYGEQRSFITQEGLAVVTTNNVTNVTSNNATCGGEITDDGGFSITARGVCWSTSQNPTTDDSHTTDGTGTGSFTSTITSLTYNTTYYVRAYATNSKGTSYGEEKSFKTSKLTPTVTTTDASSVTTNSAVAGGNVTSDGGASVTARGVCWSTSQNPSISGNHTTDGNGTGEFTSNLTDLTANTTYYIRAYATNSEGTSYGAQKTFTTTQSTSLPEVTTYQITEIGSTTATCGGFVVSDGGSTVTDRGVCWSTEHNPTLNIYYMTNDGSGIGEFVSSITGLSPNTTYYVRAYASNSVGTNYGEEKTFTTNDGLPVVTTAEVTEITQTTAVCGGNVTSDGGLTVTSRGVCWSTSPNPILNVNYMTSNGSGTGEFTSNITDLSPSTTYYVRAYASNSAGTTYGEQQTFTTQTETQIWENGILPGLFSISSSQQVHFAQGNLQYKASTNTWRFASTQYDYVGEANTNVSSSYNEWIDLFGFGTSGYNHGAVAYQPYSTSSTNSDYYVYGNASYDLNAQTGKADWGYNAISNGGNIENQWRTLTKNEWEYVVNLRSTGSGIRYAKAIVNGINGVLLLPDNWNASYYSLNLPNTLNSVYSSNVISLTAWLNDLEAHGAVFLPASGYRDNNSAGDVGNRGYYWAATHIDNLFSYYVYLDELGDFNPTTYDHRNRGRSVRLVYSSYVPATTPTVTTIQASDITTTSATCGGNVTSDGGASVTARGVCWSTSFNPTVSNSHTTDGSGTGAFTSSITGLSANTTYHVRAYATNSQGTSYGSDVTFTTESDQPQAPIGAINGLFTINSNGDQVYFSQGNLQYQASTNTWRFADNQWDYVGSTVIETGTPGGTVAGSSNHLISEYYEGWIDLFGYGTSGYDGGYYVYPPYSISESVNNYPKGNLTQYSDWGYNSISNGGNASGIWRTLTNNEWVYVFETRATSSGIRYAKAVVNNVNGVIILPDSWNSGTYSINNFNQSDADYSNNTISSTLWTSIFEANGAVFIPASGNRRGTNVNWVNHFGAYWSSTGNPVNNWYGSYTIYFTDTEFDSSWGAAVFVGLSVRLVQNL